MNGQLEPLARHLRRIAKSRLGHWEKRIRSWLTVLPQRAANPSRRRAVATRVVFTAGAVRLCRSIEPSDGTYETFVWLWPEHMYKRARKTPVAVSLVGAGRDGEPARTFDNTRRLARFIAVREAAHVLGVR